MQRLLTGVLCALVATAGMAVLPAPARAASPERETGLAYVRAFDFHTRTGYHQAGRFAPREPKPLYPLLRGVPIVSYPGGLRRNPTTIANWGLLNYSSWHRYGGRRQLRYAVAAADYLVRTQQPGSGRWLYHFDFVYVPGRVVMRAPWFSALAQGQSLSLMRRVYHATGDRRYLRAAKRALRPFTLTVEQGGLVHHRHGVFYEEYPFRGTGLFVLNGFMQSLVGLYDVSDVLPEARVLFERGVRTLPRVLPEYRLPGGRGTYDLTHRTLGRAAYPVDDGYHAAHVGLLRLLGRLRPNPVVRSVRDEWETTVKLPVTAIAR